MSDLFQLYPDLDAVATHLRSTLQDKKYILLFAFNGIGKTRLSTAFKDAGKTNNSRDTLYFNAFTEDLFSWNNDLENDINRYIKLNLESSFFDGLQELEMDTRIRPLLQRYADFDFDISGKTSDITFSREVVKDGKPERVDNIKISRGEEVTFIWCFFLAVAQLAIDKAESYDWVKYIYIDDPISSLDDNNAIAIAHHLAQMLKASGNEIKVVISTHHSLFYNIICNELSSPIKYFLNIGEDNSSYSLRKMYGDTAKFYHVAVLQQLKKVADSGSIYTYHFNMLRNLLEKAATFHGFDSFRHCIKKDPNDENGILYKRIISVFNHGNYSIFDPVEMMEENKEYFRYVLTDFLDLYYYNPKIFEEQNQQT